MNELLSALLQAVLVATLPILAAYLVRLLIRVSRLVEAEKNSRLSNEQRAVVDELVWTAVRAAEQLLRSDGIHKYGMEKKKMALTWLETWLAVRGIHVDAEELAAAVEATVHTEVNRPRGI